MYVVCRPGKVNNTVINIVLYYMYFYFQSQDAVCLSDYCDIFRCDIVSGAMKPDFWDSALCIEDDMAGMVEMCDVSILSIEITLKCFSIGTPKIINFPFVSNGKLMIFRCPNIQTDYNEAVLCLNFGTPENNEFSIWDKWKIYYF